MRHTQAKREKKKQKLGFCFKDNSICICCNYNNILHFNIKMNLLPGWVIAIFTIAEIFFTLAMVIGVLKKHRTYKLTVISLIIILFISGVYIYVTRYALATSSF